MGLDVVTAVWARKKAKIYTDTKIAELSEGLTYKGSVPTVGDLPTSGNVKGDCYNVTDGSGMYAWNGTSWGKASMAGPKGDPGPKGDKGDPGAHSVSVSATGTSTNEVNYITIDGVESKLAGGSDVSVSATGTSTNQVRYITIDGVESKFTTEALQPMKSTWTSSSLTTAQAASLMFRDGVKKGEGYLGDAAWSDLSTLGLGNAEVKAFVISDWIIQFELTSSDTAPYAWFFNTAAGVWRSYVPINDTLTSTSTKEALSANQGKQLKTLVDSKSTVGVSATGTSTNDVRYITINGTESRFASVALRAMKSEWKVSTLTTAQAATAILNDDSVIEGDGFLGTVYWSDLPLPSGTGHQAEVKAFVLKKAGSTKIIQFECTSGTVAPYAWFYNSYEGKWRSYVPLNNTVTSTSVSEALTANMGKTLQDQITNLQNIGRFLSVWNASTGKPTSEPTTLPYSYRTGDYYRVGVVNTGYYIHQISVSGTTTDSKSYTATFGFISDSKSSITRFNQVVNQLYILGYRSYATGLETSASIGSSSYTDGFVTSESGQLRFYDNSGIEVGRAANGTTVTDNVSAATIHSIYAHGYDVASKEYYIDFSFPSTSGSAYTTIGQVAEVLVKLHYSQAYPCSASGTCGSGGSVHFVYGTGSTLVLLDVNMLEIGRITTLETPSEFTDVTTGSEAPNYRPDGSTYTGTASTVVETEELEVGAVYYFDSGKWILQKSGGGGLVQDVQINGNTILDLNSGIANIPIANNSTLGAVKGWPSSGTTIDVGGTVTLVRATDAELEAKSNNYKPIVPANLNKAVMEGLGNNSLTWSDTYKSSARNTIGAAKAISVTIDLD